MPRYQWVLLDADGTLWDYDAAEAAALAETFRDSALGFEPGYAQVYRQVNGRIWREFERGEITVDRIRTERFQRLFDALGISEHPDRREGQVDAAAFGARYLVRLGEHADLIDGAAETVQALHGQVGMVLITNGLQDVQRARLSRTSIARYLADVVISEEVGVSKPERGIFDEAFRRMGYPLKEDVLIVGDSLTSDILGGSDYGIDTCWFNPTGRPRDVEVSIRYEIQALSELIDIVGARS